MNSSFHAGATRLFVYALLAAAGPSGLPLLACKCIERSPVCKEFYNSDAVFIGRVEVIEPDLNFWGFSGGAKKFKEQFSDAEIDRLEKDNSPEALRIIKELYLDFVPARYKR